MSVCGCFVQAADPEQGVESRDVHPLGILLLGDSVDFRFLKFFCQFALEEEPKPFTFFDSDWLKLQGQLLISRTPFITLADANTYHACIKFVNSHGLHAPSASVRSYMLSRPPDCLKA